MLVPAGSVGVLLGVGGGAQGLEDGNIGLRGSVAVAGQATMLARDGFTKRGGIVTGRDSRVQVRSAQSAGCVIICRS